ncbi:HEPN domain protein [Caballeronia cordobensis]|uniref:HEPN domain protein n=2 Tax=Caballeronia TaxID=1827195 RepID=A0A158HF73_CABCO|nr:HEPN domain-containing protein [Caballeronia cordobensis]SAL42300.1 HEPN domain protein [Caballeronia cordobensis]
MSSTAEELVECATALLSDAADEPRYRAVCSRAYYGAFHAAHAFHRRLPVPGTVGRARGRHEQLIAQLSRPMINPADRQYDVSQAIARDLVELRNARVMADYHLDQHVDHELASKSARIARNVLKTTT